LTARTPYGGTGGGGTQQATSPAPVLASAQQTAPLFNPSAGMPPPMPGPPIPPMIGGGMPPPPGPLPQGGFSNWQPPQQFAKGGLVQDQQVTPQGANIQASDPGAMTGMYNPEYLATALGAIVTGQPMVVNPQPSGTPSAKSGVAAVGGPQFYSTPGASSSGQVTYQLPSGTILTQDQMRALGPADVQELQKGVG